MRFQLAFDAIKSIEISNAIGLASVGHIACFRRQVHVIRRRHAHHSKTAVASPLIRRGFVHCEYQVPRHFVRAPRCGGEWRQELDFVVDRRAVRQKRVEFQDHRPDSRRVDDHHIARRVRTHQRSPSVSPLADPVDIAHVAKCVRRNEHINHPRDVIERAVAQQHERLRGRVPVDAMVVHSHVRQLRLHPRRDRLVVV